MQQLAVFTGDIIRSSDMAPGALDAVFTALEGQCRAIEDWSDAPCRFQRFRGDGWQLALTPRFALRAALVLRAAVRATGKGHDTRLGIGIGDATLAGDLASGEGPAFVRSGHALDQMRRGPQMAAPEGPATLRVALPLADRIASGWTPKQAAVIAALLPPGAPSQHAVAQAQNTTRQLVQKQAEAAGLAALSAACDAAEAPQ